MDLKVDTEWSFPSAVSERAEPVKALTGLSVFADVGLAALEPRTAESVRENAPMRQTVAHAHGSRKAREVMENYCRQRTFGSRGKTLLTSAC